jgi:hypothetical protein
MIIYTYGWPRRSLEGRQSDTEVLFMALLLKIDSESAKWLSAEEGAFLFKRLVLP